jgi:hypothetical protein
VVADELRSRQGRRIGVQRVAVEVELEQVGDAVAVGVEFGVIALL